MNKLRRIGATTFALALALPLVDDAGATAQRTFVSPAGSDANPCALTAPCRSFGAALAQTNAGGEIIVLDSAGYGAVTINKAVSIVVPPGAYAGVSVFAASDGIVVNAGVGDEVILRGLTINAQGGNNGIVFNSGAALYVESCTIRGFSLPGTANIRFAPAGAAKLFVKDSFLRGGQAGIALANGLIGASATIDNTRIEANASGVAAATFAGSITLRNSIVTENAGHAVDVQTAAGQALDVALDNMLLGNNGGNGLNVVGGGINVAVSNSEVVRNAVGVFVQGGASVATARLTNSVVSRNTTGVQTGANGTIATPLSNTIEGNGTDGTVSTHYTEK